ncbi:hypothetical protein INT47_010277 [Mucor saturninus]|uniref:Uncharacterized protein n=1 Tax=Mucor saturninus TaxID=64648 RepID=A0A8H7UW40_9FUNG|nr:hypothetical protein INT47_010277 [Mucor saturninus]
MLTNERFSSLSRTTNVDIVSDYENEIDPALKDYSNAKISILEQKMAERTHDMQLQNQFYIESTEEATQNTEEMTHDTDNQQITVRDPPVHEDQTCKASSCSDRNIGYTHPEDELREILKKEFMLEDETDYEDSGCPRIVVKADRRTAELSDLAILQSALPWMLEEFDPVNLEDDI